MEGENMDLEELAIFLWIVLKEEIVGNVKKEGNVLSVYFFDGKVRKITVE